MLGTFLHMLQGTPYVYQGEEFGMTNVAFASIEDYNDIATVNMYHEYVDEKGFDPQLVMAGIHVRSRDNARTPVQWDASPNAGFTTAKPWLKVNPNYTAINAAQAIDDPDSIFYYYQRLILLRKKVPTVIYGSYDLILPEHEQIYAFTRTLEQDCLLVILNWSQELPVFELPGDLHFSPQELLISNYPVDPADDIREFILRPYEARVYLGQVR
jgi:oligo-1,6-glucosidase